MAKIVLINPGFEPSFWSMTYSLKIFGRDAMMPTSALPLLAALTPSHHEVRIIDEAVEAFDPEALKDADIVGLTGMSGSRYRRTILTVWPM